MVGSRLRVTCLAALALIAGCASAPADDHSLRTAQQAFEDDNFDLALRYTELAMQRAPDEPRSDELALHIDVLRAAGREEEAHGFADFVRRFAAGENTYSDEAHPTRTECFRKERARRSSMRLVREYGGASSKRPFDFGYSTTTYQMDASGKPVNIRVIRARHPAAAWLAIQSVGEMKVWITRLEKLDPSVFPIDYCVNGREAPPAVPRTL